MNLVLVEACERHMKSGAVKFIGTIETLYLTHFKVAFSLRAKPLRSFKNFRSKIVQCFFYKHIAIKLLTASFSSLTYLNAQIRWASYFIQGI